ncbi:hypothetical protein HYZ80_01440 [Candidatus Parcubacteria bacterium]|nr:hypothetical protein [Candidatus Parcubacteria bacterium]
MSEKADFKKFLEKIGAVQTERDTKHECWRIGQEILRVPNNLSGTRAFRNYQAQALRTARRQGLAVPEIRRALISPRRRPKPKYRSSLPPVEEATPEQVAAWCKLEQLRWQCQQEGMGMDELKKTIIRDEDRIPPMKRVLREARKPLTNMEVCGLLSWEGEHHRRAVSRIFKAYPDWFKPTRGQKRNERYELIEPADLTPKPDVATVKPPRSTTTEPSETSAERLAELIRKIKKAVDGFGTKSSPQDAVLIIGEIRGLIKALAPEEPGTAPAAQS